MDTFKVSNPSLLDSAIIQNLNKGIVSVDGNKVTITFMPYTVKNMNSVNVEQRSLSNAKATSDNEFKTALSLLRNTCTNIQEKLFSKDGTYCITFDIDTTANARTEDGKLELYSKLKKLGCGVDQLRNSGLSIQSAIKFGYKADDFLKDGIGPKMCLVNRVNIQQAIDLGFTIDNFLNDGLGVFVCQLAGLDFNQMIDFGYTKNTLRMINILTNNYLMAVLLKIE